MKGKSTDCLVQEFPIPILLCYCRFVDMVDMQPIDTNTIAKHVLRRHRPTATFLPRNVWRFSQRSRPSIRAMRSLVSKSYILLSFALVQRNSQGFAIYPTVSKRQQQSSVRVYAGDTAATMAPPLRTIAGFRELVDHYDVFLLDMWGVLHDGTTPYDGVLDTLRKLHEHNKKLVVLSNSSKRLEYSRQGLIRLGFDPDNWFDDIITSGEVTYNLLSKSSSQGIAATASMSGVDKNTPWWDRLQRNINSNGNQQKLILFGSGDSDEEYCHSCGWQITHHIDEASLLLARGTNTLGATDSRTDPESYQRTVEDILSKAAKLRLPLLIANPDKIRPDANLSPMPGAIAERYRELLGTDDANQLIEYIGKPFPTVYQRALGGLKGKDRVCMVGDALETDVVGGTAAGIDTVWVVDDGVFAGSSLSPTELVDKFNQQREMTYARGREVQPSWVVSRFQW